jgi:hypothetical protein
MWPWVTKMAIERAEHRSLAALTQHRLQLVALTDDFSDPLVGPCHRTTVARG